MSDFWGFDTETVNRTGNGQACLLVTGQTPDKIAHHEFPRHFSDVFDILAAKPRRKHVAYHMDFDARAIVHPAFMPWKTIEKVGLFGRATWSKYSFHYIPTKFLEVQRADGRGFVLFDTKQFFGMGLRAALERYAPHIPKGDIPQSWYDEMDLCLLDHRRDVALAYARRDVEGLLYLTNDVLLKSLAGLNIRPRRLSSCASLARLRYGKRLAQVRAPDYVNDMFQRSFYGGRIECNTLGRVGACKLYDINSAYPSVIAKLLNPSTGVHLEFEGESWQWKNPHYGLYLVEADIPRGELYGPLAVRQGGKVFYPVGRVKTWCGVAGIECLRRHRFKFKVRWCYEIFDCKELIFDDIEALFLRRKDSSIGLAIKLLLNSIYGLFAEATNYLTEDPCSTRALSGCHVAARSTYGRYTNFVLASHITESVRIKVYEVMRSAGARAHFAATDGVLVDSSYDLPTGPGLGEWGLKGLYECGTVLGCGRYELTAPVGKPDVIHLRGFPVSRAAFEKLAVSKRSFAWINQLDTPSLRQWAGDGLIDSLNVLTPHKHRLEVGDDKRAWPKRYRRVCDYFHGSMRSMPYIVG
jgi:hypothetical protein